MSEWRHIRSLGVERPHQAYLHGYDEGPPGPGQVRLEMLYTGFSAGTELTFFKNTNPYLHSRWDDGRGVFVGGEAGMHYPVPFMGYMESTRVIDSRAGDFAPGDVVGTTFGHKTGHTADPFHELLTLHAVRDQLGDRAHLQRVLGAEADEVVAAGHLAVVAHDLADDGRLLEAGHAGQVDAALGLPRADQDAAVAAAQRVHVAGA